MALTVSAEKLPEHLREFFEPNECSSCYVCHTLMILREIRRVLRKDGVCFWNIGDSYSSGNRQGHGTRTGYKQETNRGTPKDQWRPPMSNGLKPKDLCLIPQRVAIAAQADGWWARSFIVWAKGTEGQDGQYHPATMPESVEDRPTRAWEAILMLTKSAKYYWDAEAIAEPSIRAGEVIKLGEKSLSKAQADGKGVQRSGNANAKTVTVKATRNLRNVWTFPTQPTSEHWCEGCRTVFPSRRGFLSRKVTGEDGNERTEIQCPRCEAWDKWGAHFATFPEELPRRCILAASRVGDFVLDPFAGSGTVGVVATKLGRRAVLVDLAYHALMSYRLRAVPPRLPLWAAEVHAGAAAGAGK